MYTYNLLKIAEIGPGKPALPEPYTCGEYQSLYTTVMKTLVAIPALNEEITVKQVISSVPHKLHGTHVEVLVVDDGSTDSTVAEARDAGAFVISHGRNMGLGTAFRTMLSYAREKGFHFMVTMDADGQFNPEDIPALSRPVIENEADFSTASRFIDPELVPDMPVLKKWGNAKVAKLVSNLANTKIHDATCGFRVYGPKALERMACFSRFTYTQEVLIDIARKGLRIKEIPIEIRGEREHGKSRIASNLWRYAHLSAEAMYSVAHGHSPWRFYGTPAFSLIGIGILLDVFTLSWWFITGMISPFTAFGIGGLFLITFGILLVLFASIADISSANRKMLEEITAMETRRIREKLGN
ncbi:MAG: glycosyltransferase family 2 protein [Candidatus Sabulitectum sp.]|nr:glycosyltransferase family 2 protein [Candidatus Sabulitectum sp.]